MPLLHKGLKQQAALALRGHRAAAAAACLLPHAVKAALLVLELLLPRVLGIPPFLAAVAQSTTPWQTALFLAPWWLVYTLLAGFAALVLAAPLQVGAANWFYRRAAGQSCPASLLVRPFCSRRFWGCLGFGVVRQLAGLFWAAVFLLPPALLAAGAAFCLWRFRPSTAVQAALAVALAAGLVLLPAAGVACGVFCTRFLPAPFVFGQGSQNPRQALGRAAHLTKGHRREAFGLLLSFVPLLALNLLILPAFFTLPRLHITLALYTRRLEETAQKKKQPDR